MSPLIVLPAAGASSRMGGRDKLLESVDGMPLLRRQARVAVATGCPVAVMVTPDRPERIAALEGIPVHVEIVPDAGEGMAASLRRAAALLTEGQPMAILLPDVPGIDTADVELVCEAFRRGREGTSVRASDPEGRPGTPLFLPHSVARQFLKLKGDDGGRSILKGEPLHLVDLGDDRATRDLDTPEAWQAWREDTGRLS